MRGPILNPSCPADSDTAPPGPNGRRKFQSASRTWSKRRVLSRTFKGAGVGDGGDSSIQNLGLSRARSASGIDGPWPREKCQEVLIPRCGLTESHDTDAGAKGRNKCGSRELSSGPSGHMLGLRSQNACRSDMRAASEGTKVNYCITVATTI